MRERRRCTRTEERRDRRDVLRNVLRRDRSDRSMSRRHRLHRRYSSPRPRTTLINRTMPGFTTFDRTEDRTEPNRTRPDFIRVGVIPSRLQRRRSTSRRPVDGSTSHRRTTHTPDSQDEVGRQRDAAVSTGTPPAEGLRSSAALDGMCHRLPAPSGGGAAGWWCLFRCSPLRRRWRISRRAHFKSTSNLLFEWWSPDDAHTAQSADRGRTGRECSKQEME